MQAEVAKLKAELSWTTEERDILKKAALSSTGRCDGLLQVSQTPTVRLLKTLLLPSTDSSVIKKTHYK
jgi:hypothetical protein